MLLMFGPFLDCLASKCMDIWYVFFFWHDCWCMHRKVILIHGLGLSKWCMCDFCSREDVWLLSLLYIWDKKLKGKATLHQLTFGVSIWAYYFLLHNHVFIWNSEQQIVVKHYEGVILEQHILKWEVFVRVTLVNFLP